MRFRGQCFPVDCIQCIVARFAGRVGKKDSSFYQLVLSWYNPNNSHGRGLIDTSICFGRHMDQHSNECEGTTSQTE